MCQMHAAKEDDKRCDWYLQAMMKANTERITIIQTNLVHTCDFSDHYFWQMHSVSNHLADHIIEIIIKNRAT